MACNTGKTQLLRAFAARGFAAKATPCADVRTPPQGVQTTTMPNKIVVTTAGSRLPVCRVAVVFRAGSRNEKYDNQGAAYMLKIAGGLSTRHSSQFAITRNMQQVGARIFATSDRELVSYCIETTVDSLKTGLRYLEDVATAPTFKPWELSDSIPRIKYELSHLTNRDEAKNLVHKAAYGGGLGNSLYIAKHNLGKISSESLMHYACETCRSDRCAVVGVGVDQDLLVGFAQNLSLESGGNKPAPAKYYGAGEIRHEKNDTWAHVAVVGEGGSYANPKELFAFAVLQHACGYKLPAKYAFANGVIGKDVSTAACDTPFSYNTLNASYGDSGLFGFTLSADAKGICKPLEAAIKALKSLKVGDADVCRGKALLKRAVLASAASDSNHLRSLSLQSLLSQAAKSPEDLAAQIDAVTEADVTEAARKVTGSKLSIAAVGNLENVPYLRDFC